MVDYVEGDGSPPPLLIDALQVRRWGVLPEAGGLRDQPAGLLSKMSAALNIYEQWSGYVSAKEQGRNVQYRRSLDAQSRRFIDSILRGKLERDSG